jgi:hypothetical protein
MSGTKRYTQPLLLACLLLFGMAAFAQEMPGDYQEVLKSLDRKGDFKNGVLKVNIPRSDLKIHAGEQSGLVYEITVGRSDFVMKDHGATINARMV